MHRIAAAVLVVIALNAGMSAAPAQERSKGISMHMLPRRVADQMGKPWGFTVDFSSRLKPEAQPAVLQTAAEVRSFVRKQDATVQRNGVWIVTTDPDAYSAEEKSLLEQVKAMCRNEKIPLFLCRASRLPNGWVRLDE